MDEFVFAAVTVLGTLLFLVIWRWLWLRGERRKLITTESTFEKLRFDREHSADEDDRMYSGRVIERLRSHLLEGRIEISWQFRKEYIHRGFILTGKVRRNDGSWEPLAFEAYQDSGLWEECFNYGESRSYLFTVKKKYHFFFGIFGDDDTEVVYDQISFSVRKGKYLKEKKELIRDRRELLSEVKEYAKLEAELRGMAKKLNGNSDSPRPQINGKMAKLEKRLEQDRAFNELVQEKEAAILANPNLSEERKKEEIEKLRDLAEEIALEE